VLHLPAAIQRLVDIVNDPSANSSEARRAANALLRSGTALRAVSSESEDPARGPALRDLSSPASSSAPSSTTPQPKSPAASSRNSPRPLRLSTAASAPPRAPTPTTTPATG
jgi:hypothetical protein